MTTVLTEDNYTKNVKLGDSYEINSQLYKKINNYNYECQIYTKLFKNKCELQILI